VGEYFRGWPVADALGPQLELDPSIDTHRRDSVHVARAWTEGKPIEDLKGLLVRRQLAAGAAPVWNGRAGSRSPTGTRRRGDGKHTDCICPSWHPITLGLKLKR
jgi:hypothetical protein